MASVLLGSSMGKFPLVGVGGSDFAFDILVDPSAADCDCLPRSEQ